MCSEEFSPFSKSIKIVLMETETIFLFERASTTALLGTNEGSSAIETNEKYDQIKQNHHRRMINDETQTEEYILEIKFTETPRIETKDSFAFASTWDMHDSFSKNQECRHQLYKLPKNHTFSNYLPFADAVVIVERVLANNVHKSQQEKFKGIFNSNKPDNLKESLYLCSFDCNEIKNIAVTGMSLNKMNDDLIAIGYGKYFYTDVKEGIVGIWSIKNPIRPERLFTFTSPVTCVEFSSDNPHLLAVGFYDGNASILDITAYEKKITAYTQRNVNPSYKPIWQIKWSNIKEIMTIGEDGRIMCFKGTKSKDFNSLQMMRIVRPMDITANKLQTEKDLNGETPLTMSCSCLIICFHPICKDTYFIGTKEGYIYKCSVNLSTRHIEMFHVHNGPVIAMQFSKANSRIFLTSGADWTVKIWSENIDEPLIVLSLNNPAEAVSFSPTHPTIIAAISNESLFIWDLKNTNDLLLMEVKLNHKKLTKMIFSNDGNNLIIGDIDGKVHIYNLHYIIVYEIDSKRSETLEHSIQKTLIVKPELLKKFNKTIL